MQRYYDRVIEIPKIIVVTSVIFISCKKRHIVDAFSEITLHIIFEKALPSSSFKGLGRERKNKNKKMGYTEQQLHHHCIAHPWPTTARCRSPTQYAHHTTVSPTPLPNSDDNRHHTYTVATHISGGSKKSIFNKPRRIQISFFENVTEVRNSIPKT